MQCNTTVPRTLTFGQAAARFGLDVLTVRRWVRTEQCPTVRVGRATRTPAAWVEAERAAQHHGDNDGVRA